MSTETSPLGYNSVKQDISPASDPNAVRIAWAFLLPIGINGDISIAAKSEWIENTAPENSGPKNGIAATSNTLEEESTPQVRQVMERGLSGGSDQDKSKAIQRIGRHTGGSIQSHKNIRLQLYQYRYYDGLFGSIQRQLMQWPSLQTNNCDELALGENAAANTIPSVYSQWRIQTHYPIEGGSLSLSVTVRNDYLMSPSAVAVLHGNLPSGSLIPNRETPISSPVRQEDADDIALNSFQRVNNKKRGLFTSVKASRGLSAKEQALARAGVFNRKRKAKEPCIIPDRFLARLDVRKVIKPVTLSK